MVISRYEKKMEETLNNLLFPVLLLYYHHSLMNENIIENPDNKESHRSKNKKLIVYYSQ